ncbi:MAG: extracellular solute-binding protein [Oscillatoriales cyanobacterium SM2_2_1]|nr:extracellular solute-binding protein [Oscillatoriales cyanobacterium SM2_2_1]
MTITRRTLLWGSAIALTGCRAFAPEIDFRIAGLSGALPNQVIDRFRNEFHRPTELKPANTPVELWRWLQSPPVPAADVVSLGDGWLASARTQGQIQPLPDRWQELIPQFAELPIFWQNQGLGGGWGIPYRWGSTAIAYRTNLISPPIRRWEDLWRPELKHRLSLPDDPREVIGLVLKTLGQSYNHPDPEQVPGLMSRLKSLHQQVLLYSSDAYAAPFLSENTWVAVGWTTDLLPLVERYPNVAVTIPEEGTALWYDLWVLPRIQRQLELACRWMNFCLTPAIAGQISTYTAATSPLSRDRLGLAEPTLREQEKFFPDAIFENSETLSPLSDRQTLKYEKLWQSMRLSP